MLITLGIIGVVAAMTLPALINKTQHQELVTSFKKVYSELSQVYMKIKADNGGTFDGLCKSSDDYYILFSKYMKKVKVCNASTVLGKCWPKDWYYSTGTKVSAEEVDSSSLILPSGTSMLFYYMSEACDSTKELKEPIGCGRIRVDLNGLKKPNVVGKDIFDFYYLINNEVLNKDKLIKYIDILIFQDKNMRENTLKDIHIRLTNILNNHRFQSRINTANNNWLEIPIKDVTDSVLDYFDGLVTIKR